MSSTVSFELLNSIRIKRAVENAKENEAIYCGLVRCTRDKCENYMQSSILPFPDWMESPSIMCECKECHEMSCAFVFGETVRIPSRRQEKLKDE